MKASGFLHRGGVLAPKRVLSALALTALLAAPVWVGGGWFLVMITVGAALCGWEWARLCGPSPTAAVMLALTVCGALLMTQLGWRQTGVLWLAAGGCALFVTSALRDGLPAARLSLAGVGYLFLAAVSLLAVRQTGDGRFDFLWLISMVAATDIGALAVGANIGGPRLAPRISPNKTWSGLAGGVCCAALVAVGFSVLAEGASAAVYALIGAATALVAQGGDLLESMLKRRKGVKDSGALIPGHGGLLDRMDGLLAAGPWFALLLLWRQAAEW